jgi:hypothetical protein
LIASASHVTIAAIMPIAAAAFLVDAASCVVTAAAAAMVNIGNRRRCYGKCHVHCLREGRRQVRRRNKYLNLIRMLLLLLSRVTSVHGIIE